MTIESMNKLFLHGLQDIYYAENQIAKALSEMMNQRIDAALFDIAPLPLEGRKLHVHIDWQGDSSNLDL